MHKLFIIPPTQIACLALVSALYVAAPAQAQSADCDLSSARIVSSRTQRLEDACLYHVQIPDLHYASRSFKLLVPDGFTGAIPRLVVDFHGFGASKASQVAASCWRDKAVEEGFVVAYPNGTGLPTSFSAGDYCCGLSLGLPRDDVQFSRDVVDEVLAILAEDPALAVSHDGWKTYASGLSNGGAMAHLLACEAADLFDGVAPVSQTFPKKPGNTCIDADETPIPVIDFRATRDIVIPYDGGYSWPTLFSQNWLSAEESRLAWAGELGCSGQFTLQSYANGTHCLRMDCETDFVQCTVEGPHVAYDAAKDAGLDICDAAWEFFGESSDSGLLP